MRYILENEKLKVEIDSFGAELKSVRSKEQNMEYMWQADARYWGRTSPVLFPFVGSLKNKAFIVDGKSYPMGQHGFARDMEHRFVSMTDTKIQFELESSEETLAKYPFPFILRICYELQDNEVKVIWEVENTSGAALPFSIGAHPAFNCPIHGEESKAGYQLSFEKFAEPSHNTAMETHIDAGAKMVPLDVVYHHGNTRDTGLSITEDLSLALEGGCCTISPEFFDRCTYFVEGNQANKVSILDPEGRTYVSVIFDTPLFAVWSPEEKNAPFLCIEPWYGRADHVDFTGELKDRAYTNLLETGKVFHSEYVMQYL